MPQNLLASRTTRQDLKVLPAKSKVRDVLVTTLAVFFLIWIITLIAKIDIKAVNIADRSVEDLELTDIIHMREESTQVAAITNNNIVLINSGNLKRLDFANLLDSLAVAGPRVIGLDVLFPKLLPNKASVDSFFKASLQKHSALVLASRLTVGEGGVSVHQTNEYFGERKQGFINFAALRDSFSTVRKFQPYYVSGNDTLLSFGLKILEQYKADLYLKALTRKNDFETINYKSAENNFIVLEGDSLLVNTAVYNNLLKDRIVLVGEMHDSSSKQFPRLKDRYFTPMNSRPFGRSYPDAVGLVIHANIIQMLLDQDYINEVPDSIQIFLTFFILLVLLILVRHFQSKYSKYSSLLIKLIQLAAALIVVFSCLLLYEKLNIKLKTSLLLAVVVLSAETLSLYYFLKTGVKKHVLPFYKNWKK